MNFSSEEYFSTTFLVSVAFVMPFLAYGLFGLRRRTLEPKILVVTMMETTTTPGSGNRRKSEFVEVFRCCAS